MRMYTGCKKITVVFALLALLLAILFLCNIGIGSVTLPPGEIVRCLLGKPVDTLTDGIIRDIRLPRALAVVFLGGALALSGFLLQTFFRNPIAGPFVLGISSGSKLVVALVLVCFTGGRLTSSAGMILAAFVGALASMGFVLLLSVRVQGASMLVVAGVMIGYICSAITDFVVTFAADADIVNLHNWSKGSFSGIQMSSLPFMAGTVLFATALAFFLSKPIGAYQLGESYAKNLGVNLPLLRVLLILLSSLLSACVVAYAGPISFVGIAVPQLMKRLLHSNRPLLMIPACFLGGSCFCLLCDLIARTMFAPTELSISTVTAVFGAPVVLLVLVQRKRGEGHV